MCAHVDVYLNNYTHVRSLSLAVGLYDSASRKQHRSMQETEAELDEEDPPETL